MSKHKRNGGRQRLLTCIALFLGAGLWCNLSGYSRAQSDPQSAASETAKSKPGTEAASESKAEASPENAGRENGQAEREKEKKEQEELEALRKSPAVMKLSSMTGMKPDTTYWASVILNFVLIAVLLIYMLRGKAPSFFRERTAGIQNGLAEAARVSQEATQRLQQIEGRLFKLDVEIEAMRATAENEARAEEERLKLATEEEQHRLLEAAQQEIASATSQARRELKGFAAELAIALAEKQIHVDAAADKNLVQTFATHLGNEQVGQNQAGSEPAGGENQ